MVVTWRRQGEVAYVELDNPPVNAISRAVRRGLIDATEWVEGQSGLERVILSGLGKIFAAGADAREFDLPPLEPHLPDVLDRIEASTVPWIAAARGAALGGGAEIMLACRYRIAAPDARIGFPEVTLGVVPGAGGTQRLPRMVGLAAALDLVVTGKPITAQQALEVGLIDAIDTDVVTAAESLALDHFGARGPVSGAPAPAVDETAIEAARKNAAKRMAGQVAPQIAIDLLENATTLSYREAMAAEREAFLTLREGEQARALRHVFFAERGARSPDWLSGTAPLDIRKIAVVGGGNMGAAIAYALLSAGYLVVIIETDDEAVGRARANAGRIIETSLKRGLITQVMAEDIQCRLDVTVDFSRCGDVELAIEAAFESMEVKKQVFLALEEALPENAVLATNTSYLNVNEIADVLQKPERLVGLHFFAPAHIMKLLEIVKGEKTSDLALATGFAIAARLKKIPVLAGVCDGFIGNRILSRYREAADIVMIDGSNPWEIDEAMVEFGYSMGPYEAQDLSGLDIAYANRKRQAATRDPNRRYVPVADRMVHEGRLGRKTAVGWYRYPGGEGKIIDPLVEDLVREEAYFGKITRREFSPEEIRRRLLLAMINEAAEILREGIAARPSDIDLVLVHGYGFPRFRGGLLHFADQWGLKRIHSDLVALSAEDPVVWAPSALIANLARQNRTFSSLA
jgi:3-hydroxyacyl-CoA dehydrogenase